MNDEQAGRLLEKVESIHDKVVKIDETINGNGKEGLKTTVARHEGTLRGIFRFLWIVVVALVGVAVAAVGL